MTIEEAREKAATLGLLAKDDIEDWRVRLKVLLHDANLGTRIRWRQELRALATIDDLLAQLKDSEGKLAAIRAWRNATGPNVAWSILDSILQGGK